MASRISPKDVVNALKTLNDEQSKELFFQLDVQLYILDRIEGSHKGNMRKIHYVQAWFDQEVEASWEKIVAGLKLIGMNALAETLATQQCLGGTPTSAAINLTPDFPSSPATAPEKSGPQTSGSSPSGLSLGSVARPSSPSSPSDRVSQVRAEIDRLSDTFSDLMSDTRDEMCTREIADPSFLQRFRDRLLDLPVAKKAPHTKFFFEHVKEFLKASMEEIFAIIRLYCSYRNYAVLEEVIRKFCEAVLQQRMREYCESLKNFEKATFIDVYLKSISAGVVLSEKFTKMILIINKPISECTLHEVRKTTEAVAEKADLQSYSVYIGAVLKSSVQLELGFPASCVGWILGVCTPNFLATRLLSDVVLGQQRLLILDWPQEKLVCSL